MSDLVVQLWRKHFARSVRRGLVGYVAPVISLCRLRKKRSWNYLRQLRVVYRYTFWK